MANPFEDDVQSIIETGPTRDLASKPLTETESYRLADEVIQESNYESFKNTANYESGMPDENVDVKAFAEANDVDEERAKKYLSSYPEEDARVLINSQIMASERPEVIEWASKPENYRFLKKNYPHLLKATDPKTTGYTPIWVQDVGKALHRNMPMIENMVAVGRYSVGETSKEEFAETLENIRQRRDNQTPYGTDTSGFDAALAEFNREWGKGTTLADVAQMSREDLDDYVKVVTRAMQVSGASVADISNFVWAVVSNNKWAATLKSVESLGAVLGPTAGALAGGKLGAIGGPKTALVGGLAGGTLGSGLVRYAQEVEEQLNAYIDANPGSTYLDALEDPEVMANVKKVATTYGLVGGALDTLLTRLGGRIATKGLKGHVAALAADVGGEGVAEAGATTAKEVAKGKPALEALGEGVREGVVESILAAPTSAGLSYIPMAGSALTNRVLEVKRKTNAKLAAQEVKTKIDTVKKDMKEVVKTPEDAAKVREITKKVQEDISLEDITEVLSRKEEVVLAEEEAAKETPVQEVSPEETAPTEVSPEGDIDIEVPEETAPPKEERRKKPRQQLPKRRSRLREQARLDNISLSESVIINPAMLYQKYHSVPEEQRKMSWDEYVSYFPAEIQEQLRNTTDDTGLIFIEPTDWAIANSQGITEDLDEVIIVQTPWGFESLTPQEEEVAKEEVDATPIPKETKKKGKKETKKGVTKVVAKKFGRFQSLAEENQYNSLKKRISKSLLGVRKNIADESEAITPEAVQIFVDMFFNMARRRAEILGKPISTVLGEYEFKGKDKYRFGGSVTGLTPGFEKSLIKFNKKYTSRNELNIIIHEFGHVLLNGMISDWDFIMSIPEDKLTPSQEHYKETMLLTAKMLKVPNLKGIFTRSTKSGFTFSPIQERFTTSLELFFKEGRFNDTDTGRVMLRFQDLMRQTMNKDQLYQIGKSYESYGVSAIRPRDISDPVMVFNSLMDAGEKLQQEVYPIVPPPEFDRTDLGSEYEKWMKQYREAVEKSLLKVYKELFNDNLEYYRTHYPETYQEVYNQLLDSPVGYLHSLLKDGYITLYEGSFASNMRMSIEFAKKWAKKEGIQLATTPEKASTTIDNLVEQGVLPSILDAHDYLLAAIRLEQTAVTETIKRLEEQNEDIPRVELQDLSNIILSDENIRKVREQAGKIVKRKLIKELDSDENIVSTLKKEIKASVTDKALNHKAQVKLLDTVRGHKQRPGEIRKEELWIEKQYPNDPFLVFSPTPFTDVHPTFDTGYYHLKKGLGSKKQLEEAKKRQSKEAQVDEAVKTGEIPTMFTAVEQLLVSEKKDRLAQKADESLGRIDSAWEHETDRLQIIVKSKGQPDIYMNKRIIGTKESVAGVPVYTTENKTIHSTKDDGIYDLAKELMDKREFTNVWSRLKYAHILNEADLKARVLAKLNFIPDSKAKGTQGITHEDIKGLLDGPDEVVATVKVPVDAMPIVTDYEGRVVTLYRGQGMDYLGHHKDKTTVFFSTSKEIAETYITSRSMFPYGEVLEGTLNLENPLYVDAEGANWDEIRVSQEWGGVKYDSFQEAFQQEGIDIGHNLDDYPYVTTNHLVSLAKKMGFDSLVISDVVDSADMSHSSEESDVYVIFDPKKFKEKKRHKWELGEQVDAMPIPQAPSPDAVVSPTKKINLEDAHTALANKVESEIHKFKKARKEPKNFFQKYIAIDSIGIKNFIAAMMPEKDLPNSWLYSLFQKVSEAEAEKNVVQRKLHIRLTEAIKKIAKSKKDTQKLMGEGGGIFSFLTNLTTKSDGVVSAPELGENVTFSNIGQVVTALLYMGSESGRRKMLLGGFLNSEGIETGPLAVEKNGDLDTTQWDAFIQRLITEGQLNEEMFDFIQEVHDIFTEIYPKVKESFQKADNLTINFVEGREYTVKFADGTKKKYRGGYYPLLPDRTLAPLLEGSGQSALTEDQFSIVYDTIGATMSKHRGGQIYPMNLGLGSLMGLLNRHLTHAYIKRPLLTIENLRSNKRIVQAFENRQKGFIKYVLNPWIERVAKQQYAVANPGFWNSAALYLRRTTYPVLFLAKLGPITRQLFGIPQAFATTKHYVGNGKVMKHFLKTTTNFWTGGYKTMKEDIGKQSIYMKDRLDNNERHLIRGWDELDLSETVHGSIMSSTEHYTFLGMQMSQNIVDMSIWMAAVEKVKADGGTDAQAIAYADGLVERTQASSNISSRPASMHGTNFERLAMMITMVHHSIRGRLYEEAARAENQEQSKALARLTALTWMIVVPNILEHIVGQMAEQLGDDDEDKNDPELMELMARIASDTGTAFAPQIAQLLLPAIQGGVEAAAGIDSQGSKDVLGMGPIANPARRGVRGITALGRKWGSGVPMTNKEMGDLLIAMALMTGIPLSPISNIVIPFKESQKSPTQKRLEAQKRRRALQKARRRR